MNLNLTVNESAVLAMSLAVMFSCGSEEPDQDRPLTVVGICNKIAQQYGLHENGAVYLELTDEEAEEVCGSIAYAVAFYDIFKPRDYPAVRSLVAKIDDQSLIEEVSDYLADKH